MKWLEQLREPAGRWRLVIAVSAALVCAYAAAVTTYSLSVADVGVRTAFTPVVNHFFPEYLWPAEQQPLLPDDHIVQIGNQSIVTWPQIPRTLRDLSNQQDPLPTLSTADLADPRHNLGVYEGEKVVRVRFLRPGEDRPRSAWCRTGQLRSETLAPSILWFVIKGSLFTVGALVFWKRPDDASARLFFLFCLVSCGAYLGGYHWWRLVTQPPLLVVFVVCAILLPAVSLHFYLVFPRPKPFFQRWPWLTLTAIYGLPLFFLVRIFSDYLRIRWLLASVPTETVAAPVNALLTDMIREIYAYFAVAFVWYLASIVCLVHSHRKAHTTAERNQVKWILFGAVAALFPLGYSGYLAVVEQGKFGGGAAAWPMFLASLCVTLAFTISITRYRLMQLDQLLSSGAIYFAISGLGAVVYYGLFFGGVLLVGSQFIQGPTVGDVLRVAGTVLVLTIVLDLGRHGMRAILDRHFRREKHQLDQTVQRISQAIAQIVDSPTLARRLLQTSTELLGVDRGAVYLRSGEPSLFQMIDALGPPPPLTELPPGCPLIEASLTRGTITLRPADRETRRNGDREDPALRQLIFLGKELAHPLIHEGRLLALLVLGAKKDGSYTHEDLTLLAAIGQMTVPALVSSEGGRTIEALHRELQTKVDKIAEQQRRILALQSQLRVRQGDRETRRQGDGGDSESGEQDPSISLTACLPASPSGIVGSSPAVRQVLELVRKVAGSPSPVLLRGESGTGKELLARALHEQSPRAAQPFLQVHCAALAPTLLESELFGHVKGAFTGAVRDRAGRFELAHGGTLFLDEIGDISLEVQTKLLRVLQEMTFERVGSSEPIQVDVRIIAATHQDLERLIQLGRFREDLFYRLNVLPIQVPSLRSRAEDVPELVIHFLKLHGGRSGKPDLGVEDDALALLKSYHWPGNVRQLENAIQRAVVIAEGSLLTLADLPEDILETAGEWEESNDSSSVGEAEGPVLLGVQGERAERERRERDQIVRALTSAGGNKAEAARALGLARSTFLSRLKKHGLG